MQLFKTNLQKIVKSFNIAYMEYNFVAPEFDKKSLLENETSGINRILLDNASLQIEAVFNFLCGRKKLLLVNGFMGTGKTSLIDHILTVTNQQNVVLNYNCFETTIIDDILLTFFEEFKKLSALEIISPLKSKTENFTQKINAYFESIDKPIIVVLNSFDFILKSNKKEILEFINYICTLENIKVIITSRIFNYEDFKLDYDRTTILALEKPLFEKYLRSFDIKQIGPLSDELYKLTRGYFFYTDLSLRIMKLRNLSLIDFLDGYAKSFLSYNDFILREALALIDPVSGHLFRFLTLMRHPVTIKLLKNLQLYNEEKVLFFLQNNVLSRFGEYIYLKDYYKIIAENSISETVAIKIHQGCVDLYNTQLPLKPLERDLTISRQTMRNEIEFHSLFIPKKKQIQLLIQPENKQEIKTKNAVEIAEQKDEQIKKMSFIFDDDETGVLDKIADSIKNFMTFNVKKAEEEKEENTFSLTQLINKAKQKEQDYDFKHAINLYLKALAHKDDDDFYTYLPTIYSKLAFAYQNISDWFNAQKYFELSMDFYNSTGDLEKICEQKYNIANLLYMTFKQEKAKEILLSIKNEKISDELRIKILTLLANLTTDKNLKYEYYSNALEINPLNTDKNILSELYYKFALECEYRDDEKKALEFYKKCISLNMKKNPNLANALSNIAMFYDDIGEKNYALKYYLESYKIFENDKNLNGLYSSAMKLAELYSVDNEKQAIEFFEKALNFALALNENFYIISVNTAIGDFYFNKKNDKKAYDSYKKALSIAQVGSSKENINKIQQRINDIKIRLGEERFKQIEE